MKKIFLIICLITLFSFPLISLAQGLVPCGRNEDDPDTPYNETDPCQLCHIFVLLNNILDFIFFTLTPPIAILMIAIAGAYYMLAGGNPNMLGQAKSILKSTAIALLIIYGAWLFVNLFFWAIGAADWTGFTGGWRKGWFEMCCPGPCP